MLKKIMLAIGVLIAALVIFIVVVDLEDNETTEEPKNIKELVHDYSVDNLTAEAASINSKELIVQKSNKETTYELPEDEFFVSIAPYFNETHPCAIHSLTGCMGELANEEFDVYIEDEEGNVIVDETLESLDNGFIDLWLPRDKTYQITIEKDGKSQTSEISTFEGDDTCVTTIQLETN